MDPEIAASNASFEAMICGTDEYVRRHGKLCSLLSNGFFKFSQAARDARSVIRIDDIREDIEATLSIRVSEQGVLTLVSAKGEDIEYFCGLPPPALRTAQKHFKQALSEAVDMSICVQSIRQAASSLESERPRPATTSVIQPSGDEPVDEQAPAEALYSQHGIRSSSSSYGP
jgi:hypothetical protein